ncbi:MULTISPECIES: cystine ABC transporter substrate-binding protein [Pseudomonas]|uniref:cystine ABC transporter substrate-binding protein n=1 Tax=Pseudomonas sp. TaxID=306 RepID=UPI000CC79E2B|nr:cystine ABC transporter substrate-binding protein [Pseudomonas sp.]PJI49319.1 MAG: cystine ABC transporter substrate-binding protein [Pseudomonas sp.]
MTFSALRRHFLLASLTLTLGAGLFGQAQAADDLLAQIKEKGQVRVGLEGTYPPFSFQDENGKLAGFEVDFSNLIAKELGATAKLQPTKWDGILAALESKRLDLVINQVTISEERKKKYDFSDAYTVSGIQALVRKGDEGKYDAPEKLAGVKVGVGLGTNYEQWLREHVPQADVRTYEDDPTKFQDLRSGRIDVILVDRLAAFDMVNKTNGAMALTGAPFARQEAGIALRKGNPELLAALNKAIEKLRADGTLKQLSEKWFKADVTQ